MFELSQTFPWRQVFSREPQLLCVTWVTDVSWRDCFLLRKSFTFCKGLGMFIPAPYASTCQGLKQWMMQRLCGQKSFPVSTEHIHYPGWWYSLPQSSQQLCARIQAQPERKNITVGLIFCKGNSVLGDFWVASAPCQSRRPRGQTHLCVLMPVLRSQSSLRRGRTPLRYPAVLTIQVIQASPGKKDELAFFSSDDGDVMIW